MNHLNSRQVAILKSLLQTNSPISANELGEKIGLSARIIRHNIPFINFWLEQYAVEIQSKPNSGLMVPCSPEMRLELLKKISAPPSSVIYSQKDREYIILFRVLSTPEGFSEEDLRNTLSVSRTTLNHDWDRVERWLNRRDLFLTRRPKIGVSVQGRENDFRHALIALLFEIGVESELMDLSLWGIKPSGRKHLHVSPAAALILDEVAGWGLNEGWETIGFIENELDTHFADGEHLTLTFYWAIMLRRIKHKHFIQLSDERIGYLSSRPEYAVVQAIVEKLIDRISLRLNPPEIAQLTLEVMTARGEFRIHGKPESHRGSQEKTTEIARRLVTQVGGYLGTNLENSEVILRLTDHLSRVIIRIKFGLPFQNKLTEEIKQAYPLLWQATSKAVNEIWDEAGPPLPVEEIAYITMYMALALQLNKNAQKSKQNPVAMVACPSGGVTVWMLVSRLRSELPEIEIKEVISLRDVNKVNPGEVDVIICTSQVNSRNIKTITVNPLLGEEDILRIRQELGLS